MSLEDLARRDRHFAAELLVELVCSLKKGVRDTEVYDKIVDGLKQMFAKATERPNDFAPTAMQIMLRSGCPVPDAERVRAVAKAMNLQPLGILLLEQDANRCDKLAKASGINAVTPAAVQVSSSTCHRLELASLYRSIGEHDLVASVLGSSSWSLLLNSEAGTRMRQAGLAEARADWMAAKGAYEEACESEIGLAKECCVTGLVRVSDCVVFYF